MCNPYVCTGMRFLSCMCVLMSEHPSSQDTSLSLSLSRVTRFKMQYRDAADDDDGSDDDEDVDACMTIKMLDPWMHLSRSAAGAEREDVSRLCI